MTQVIIPKWGTAEPNSGYWYQMDTPFGRYTIWDRGEYGFGWKRPAHRPFMGFFDNLNDAKRAAEDDYRKRILSAVESI